MEQQKFGRLTPVRFVRWHLFKNGKRHQVWEFVCDCGNTSTAFLPNVKSGHTKSCGCLGDENRKERIQLNTIHGDNRQSGPHPLYVIWCGMKQRCNDPKWACYKNWGGRGIKLIWNSYAAFKSDMESSYRVGLTIERNDVNGNYCKENCRWISRSEQSNNKRNTKWIEFEGTRLNLAQWAKKIRIKRHTLVARFDSGWTIEKSLTTKTQGGKKFLANGRCLKIRQWSQLLGISKSTLYARLENGWSTEKTLTTPLQSNT